MSAVAKAVAFFVRHATTKSNLHTHNSNTHLKKLSKLVKDAHLERDIITMEIPIFDEYLQSVEPAKRLAYVKGMDYFLGKDKMVLDFNVMQKSNEK